MDHALMQATLYRGIFRPGARMQSAMPHVLFQRRHHAGRHDRHHLRGTAGPDRARFFSPGLEIPRLAEIIARGKNAGVPYISLITNGQLIASGKVSLPDLVKAGLNEITLSMHGTRQETYEHLMTGAKFSNLLT